MYFIMWIFCCFLKTSNLSLSCVLLQLLRPIIISKRKLLQLLQFHIEVLLWKIMWNLMSKHGYIWRCWYIYIYHIDDNFFNYWTFMLKFYCEGLCEIWWARYVLRLLIYIYIYYILMVSLIYQTIYLHMVHTF